MESLTSNPRVREQLQLFSVQTDGPAETCGAAGGKMAFSGGFSVSVNVTRTDAMWINAVSSMRSNRDPQSRPAAVMGPKSGKFPVFSLSTGNSSCRYQRTVGARPPLAPFAFAATPLRRNETRRQGECHAVAVAKAGNPGRIFRRALPSPLEYDAGSAVPREPKVGGPPERLRRQKQGETARWKCWKYSIPVASPR